MPFTFSFDGSFFHLADFFHRLQQFVVATNKRIAISGRLMTLDGISFGAGQGGFPNITATVAATTFLEPADQGLTNGATGTAPSGAGSSTSTGGAPTVAATAGVAR
jgi:hypothetical protein